MVYTLEHDVARLDKEKVVEKQKGEASLLAASEQLVGELPSQSDSLHEYSCAQNLVKSSVIKLENDVQLLRSEKAKENQRAETAISSAHEKSVRSILCCVVDA